MATKNRIHPSGFQKVGRVRVDERKRVLLGKKIKTVFSDYEVYESTDGQLLLVPMVLIPAREAWLHKNKTALESVNLGLRQSARGETVKKPSLAKHANDKID